MVFILGLVLLQVLRPIPGPSSPHNMTSSPEVQTIVPDNALQPGSTYGGNLGPLPSAPVVETLSDSFHPSIAVIIGVLSTMFSLTFLILLYAKHCKRASVTMYGGVDHDIIATPALASALFTDRDSGLDRAVVEALPMFSFSALKGMKEGLECAVCLSKYESPELLRLLPQCKHAFHLDCVDVWLNHHSTCPLCRHRVDAQDTLVVEDFLSAFVKPASEAGSFRNSARISLSELTSENPDRTFEFYVQREADIPDLGGCWPHSSGGSWRKDAASIGSDRKLGSWRRDNFSGQIGASERKEGSARVVRSSQASQRKTLDTDHAAVLPLNFAGDAHLDYYDEQLARRLGHRIIVSDVLFQHRWSDFLPSDVPFFNGNTVHLRQQSMSSVPVSSELAKDPGAGGDSFSAKEDVEMGLKFGGENILHERTTVTGGSARMSNSKVADVEAALAQLQASAASAEISRAALKQGSMERKERQIRVSNSKGDQRGWVAGQQRCMSEMSGLQRVQQVAAGKQLLAESEAVEEAEDETTRRWFATARRTLKWLMGSNAGVRPTSSAATANPPAD